MASTAFEVKQEGKFKYLEEGEGSTLLLLHGLFGALSNFNDLISHFSKTYRVVVPVLPIYELPLRQCNITSLVKHIEEFVLFKQYSNIDILGNSLGGHISLLYVLKQLSNVRSLTLTGSSGLFENAFGDSFPRRGDYEYIRKKTELTFYDPKMATKELVDEVYNIVTKRDSAMRVVAVAKSAIRQNMGEELHKITCPTLLIWGKQDQVTPPFVAEDFHKLLPDSQLHILDKSGHAPMMERPNAFIQLLEDFLIGLESK